MAVPLPPLIALPASGGGPPLPVEVGPLSVDAGAEWDAQVRPGLPVESPDKEWRWALRAMLALVPRRGGFSIRAAGDVVGLVLYNAASRVRLLTDPAQPAVYADEVEKLCVASETDATFRKELEKATEEARIRQRLRMSGTVDESTLRDALSSKDDGLRKHAFEVFVKQSQSTLFRLIFRMVREAEAAEDLTHETYLRLFRDLDALSSERSPYAFARRVAMNTATTHWRRSHPTDKPAEAAVTRQSVGAEPVRLPGESVRPSGSEPTARLRKYREFVRLAWAPTSDAPSAGSAAGSARRG